MTHLVIHHRTMYRYRQPVLLSPHRLLLRPRESRELQILSHQISISPDGEMDWAHDVYGNTLATASFVTQTDKLTIESISEVVLTSVEWPVFNIAASAITYPFRYADDDWADLGALTMQQYTDERGQLAAWARSFIAREGTDTLSLLKDLSAGVSRQIAYQSRDEEGTQTPIQTLDRGWGTCRDFAVLFAEAVRSLGFGARIVSGYLFDASNTLTGSTGAGTTHAWTEVFIPGSGWIAFDPTNRSVGGANLIPVSVTRDIAQSVPVSGTFFGSSDAFMAMNVEVGVKQML